MKRIVPYLGIVAAVALVAIMTLVVTPTSPRESSQLAVDTATTTQTREAAPLSSPAAAVTAFSEKQLQNLLGDSAGQLERALVNIFCIAAPKTGIPSISGSGVIIDAKGIIVTNAHIGQYFLLDPNDVSCTVRSGSPARARYEAQLVYISPLWVTANAHVLTTPSPVGTGEYDYALLGVTSSAGASLPSSFPFTPFSNESVALSMPVAIASYGSSVAAADQIAAELFPTVVLGTVKKLFTFAQTSVDVMALGGSAAAEHGSSGGGVANARGDLVGVITTSTTEGALDARSLHAITASYIRRAYTSETGASIDALLSQSPSDAVKAFEYRIPALRSIITAQLK